MAMTPDLCQSRNALQYEIITNGLMLARSHIKGAFVCKVSFAVMEDKDLIETRQLDVACGHRKHGHTPEVIACILKAFPEFELRASQNLVDMTDSGRESVTRMRAEGAPYHERKCFDDGVHCFCGLGRRARGSRHEAEWMTARGIPELIPINPAQRRRRK